MEILVSEPEHVRAVLADQRFVPVPAPAGGPVGSMAWLRATVARFSHGAVHERRRALVEAELAVVDPQWLRVAAAGSRRPAAEVAPAVLAEALGVRDVDAVVEALPAVAAVYLAPGDAAAERAADAAVAELTALVRAATPDSAQHGGATAGPARHGGATPHPPERIRAAVRVSGQGDELVANRIGLLVQAYAATAGLVRAVLAHGSVADGLRAEPPVRTTRRVATVDSALGGTVVAAGDELVLDLAAAGLPFGGEPRICPGREHAIAIAEAAGTAAEVVR